MSTWQGKLCFYSLFILYVCDSLVPVAVVWFDTTDIYIINYETPQTTVSPIFHCSSHIIIYCIFYLIVMTSVNPLQSSIAPEFKGFSLAQWKHLYDNISQLHMDCICCRLFESRSNVPIAPQLKYLKI